MDLNADLGESFGAWRIGADDALLKLVTSANVACGFHAGDPSTMRAVCASAAARGVAVGAHVGYRDLAGFGRRHIAYQARELSDEVLYQITALDGMAPTSGSCACRTRCCNAPRRMPGCAPSASASSTARTRPPAGSSRGAPPAR